MIKKRKRGLREQCLFMKLGGGERLRETKSIFKQQAGSRAEGSFNFNRVLLFSIFIIVLVGLEVVSAATYDGVSYTEVFYLSATGDGTASESGNATAAYDATDFNTAGNWANVDSEDNKLGPNDCLVMLDDGGNYDARLTIQNSGLVNKSITIRSGIGETPVIAPSSNLYDLYMTSKSYITIRGLTLTTGNNSHVKITGGGSGLILDDLIITGNNSYGIIIEGGATVTISDTNISDIIERGVYSYENTNNINISNLTCAVNSATARGVFILNANTLSISELTTIGIYTYGLQINTVSNVSVNNFTANGTGAALSVNSLSNITLNTLTSSKGGISLTSVNGAIIHNLNIFSVGGISIQSCSGIFNWSNISVSGSTSSVGGVYIKNSSFANGSTITNLISSNNDNSGLQLDGSTSNLDFINCTFNNNTSTGMYTTSNNTVSNITFSDCTASSNKVDGFSVRDRANNIKFLRCIADSNGDYGTDTAGGDGFTAHETNHHIQYHNCISKNNKNTGFALVGNSSGEAYNCVIANNGEAPFDRGGIYLSLNGNHPTENSSWIFKNNIIYNNYPVLLWINVGGNEFLGDTLLLNNNYYYDSNYTQSENETFSLDSGLTEISWDEYSFNETLSNYLNPLLINVSSNFSLQWNSPAIDTGTDVNLTTDYLSNPIYGTPDIGAYEYQPPYNITTDSINTSISKSIRIYGNGKYRYINSTTDSIIVNLSVEPVQGYNSSNYSQWIDINITSWNTSGTYYKNWTEDGSINVNVSHTIGNLPTNAYFTVKVDSVVGQNITGANCTNGLCLSDASGKITFNYTGGYSSHIFELVDATPPTLSFSCSPTSVTTGETITCSCSATDAIDSSPTVSYTANPSTSSTGTFTTTCTATDDAGNSGSSSISYTVSSSSSGGGTSSFYTNTIVQDNKEFSEIGIITKELKKKERVKIQIDSEEHYVGIADLTNTTATIEIFSTSQKNVFNIGDENKFEVSNDNYYDVYVKLNSISNNKANLTIKSIYEEIPAEKKEVGKEEVAVKELEDETDKRVHNWAGIIIPLVIASIILIFIVIITSRHRLKI